MSRKNPASVSQLRQPVHHADGHSRCPRDTPKPCQRLSCGSIPIAQSWGKSPKDTTATRDEILARAATLAPDKVGLSVGTINRHLEHLGQIIEWADDEGIKVDQKLNATKLRRADTVRDRDKRKAFSEEEVRAIFTHEVWQDRGQGHERSTYWEPIIAAYSGARRAEIAGLAVTDIVEVEGEPCFDIRPTDDRRIKNLPSKRIVPIHSHLIELVFLGFVEDARRRGRQHLFPEQREKASGVWGRKLWRAVRPIIDAQLGEGGLELSFHSYRHYVQNALDHRRVDDKVVRDIVGHEGKDEHERTYRKRSPITELKAGIESLPRVL